MDRNGLYQPGHPILPALNFSDPYLHKRGLRKRRRSCPLASRRRLSSWIKLSDRTRLWGNARYTTGKETGVVWNETADFELLYPYVMADSFGGDLSLQEYAFTGGYSGRAGKFTWGIEGSYRAALEYRNRDPRPKNIVSDLDFAGGGSVRLGKYVVGISVMAQI